MSKGLTYEEAHAAKPVGYIFQANTTLNDLSKSVEKHITFGEKQNAADVNVYTEDVVNTLKVQIASLEGSIEGHKEAVDHFRTKYEAERQRQFAEAGWFVPATWISGPAAESLDHLIERAKHVSITDITVAPGPNQVKYEGDWIKYAFKIEARPMPVAVPVIEASSTDDKVATLFDAIKHGDEAHQNWLKEAIEAHFAGEPIPAAVMKATEASNDDQSWVVKLGAAIARYRNPRVINEVTTEKVDEMVKRLMKNVGMPESLSLYGAFLQLINEITYDSAALLDVVQLVAGNKKESEVFWGNPVEVVKGSPLYTVAAEKLCTDPDGGTQPVKVEDAIRNWVASDAPVVVTQRYDAFYQNARQELDCTSCPMQAVLEGCCKEIRSSTDRQREYEFELGKYTDALDASLEAYVSESMFKTAPEYMAKVAAQMREHYLTQWKEVNGPLFLGKEFEKRTFFTEAQLQDPTLLQKAVVMGMAGTPKQQEEARHYLTQFLAVTSKSHAAADAFLKL